jgi:hypothetical protein
MRHIGEHDEPFFGERVPDDGARRLARGLGWLSLALGAAELAAPGGIRSRTGLPAPAGAVQAYGLREVATGAAILTSRRPVAMVWARVVGDLLDLATLAPALRHDNPHRPAAMGAFGFVALVTAADVLVAMQGDGPASRR